MAEQEANLSGSNAYIACWYVGVLTNMSVQLGHKGLAKPHNLIVRSSLGIEIRTTLTPSDWHPAQRVFEDLLETQEFNHAQIDGGMKPQTTLKRPKGRVELNPKTTIDLHRS